MSIVTKGTVSCCRRFGLFRVFKQVLHVFGRGIRSGDPRFEFGLGGAEGIVNEGVNGSVGWIATNVSEWTTPIPWTTGMSGTVAATYPNEEGDFYKKFVALVGGIHVRPLDAAINITNFTVQCNLIFSSTTMHPADKGHTASITATLQYKGSSTDTVDTRLGLLIGRDNTSHAPLVRYDTLRSCRLLFACLPVSAR